MINKVSVKWGYFHPEHWICSFSVFSAGQTFYEVGKLQSADIEDVGGTSDVTPRERTQTKPKWDRRYKYLSSHTNITHAGFVGPQSTLVRESEPKSDPPAEASYLKYNMIGCLSSGL